MDASTIFSEGDIRHRVPRLEAENLAANQALVDHLMALAGVRGATPGQIALAWLRSQQPWIVPIPGTRRTASIEENASATQVTLSAGDRADLDPLALRVGVRGDRYNATHMAHVNRWALRRTAGLRVGPFCHDQGLSALSRMRLVHASSCLPHR
ncbi:hypothetical protein GCM10028802_31820 [Terrabacter terrigena]